MSKNFDWNNVAAVVNIIIGLMYRTGVKAAVVSCFGEEKKKTTV